MNNQNLFAQTHNEILKNVLKGNNDKFQLLSNPINFNWPVTPNGQGSPQAYQLADRKPKYSEVGNFEFGDASFFDSYCQLVSHLTFKVDEGKQRDLQTAKDAQTQALNDLNNIISASKTQFDIELANNGPEVMTAIYGGSNYSDFFANSPYKTDYQNAKKAYDGRSTFYNELAIMLSTDSTVKKLNAAIKRPEGTSPAPGWVRIARTDGYLEWCPAYEIAKTAQTLVRDWKAAGMSGGFTVKLNTEDKNSSFDKSWANGNGGGGNFFWGFSGSGGWEKTETTNDNDKIKVEVSAKASALVPVTPGQWYNGGFLQALARNEQGSGFKLENGWEIKGGAGSNSAFGEYGLLSCRITALVVVYKLSYKITMDSNSYKAFHQKFEASSGLRIGPFRFGASGGHESTIINRKTDGTSFSGEDSSDDPQIIGVLLSFPGLDAK